MATNEQVADCLTKALAGPALKKASERLSGDSTEKAAHEVREERTGAVLFCGVSTVESEHSWSCE